MIFGKKLLGFISDRKFLLVQSPVVQRAFGSLVALRYIYYRFLKKNTYLAFHVALEYERFALSVEGWKPATWATRANKRVIADLAAQGQGCPVIQQFHSSREALSCRREFQGYGVENTVRLRFPREKDTPARQGDLLVLKPYVDESEKGVILLQYTEAFQRFHALFDVEKVAQDYRIVLEPSWWGYRDVSILFFLAAATDVIVEAQDASDYQFLDSLNTNLVPLRIGAGDWMDPGRFGQRNGLEKIYDVVMVANWLRLKRHELLFRAISRSDGLIQRVALIGYAHGGRTSADIMGEAKKWGVSDRVELFESISRDKVSEILSQSKLGVMLTLREGANRGIYECFFSNIPVVISDRNFGVNREHINSSTGMTANDDQLEEVIVSVLSHLSEYRPREWAETHTGYKNATRQLNDCLRSVALAGGENWTRDIFLKKNDTNSTYVKEEDRLAADEEMIRLRSMLRG